MIAKHNALKQLYACLIADDRSTEVEDLAKKHINKDNEEELRYYLSLAYARQGKVENAIGEIEKVLEKNHNNEAARNLAFKLYIHKARNKTNDDKNTGTPIIIAKALRLAPDNTDFHEEFAGFKSVLPLSCIMAGNREEAAVIWEKELKESPGNQKIIHNLALLYYWWALDAEEHACRKTEKENIKNDGEPAKKRILFCGKKSVKIKGAMERQTSKSIDSLWRKSIGYWASLITMDDFWKEWKNKREKSCSIKIKDDHIQQLRKKILNDRFNKLFNDYIDHYKRNGKEECSKRHEDYMTTLLLERRGASYFKDVVTKIRGLGIKIDDSIKRWELIRFIQGKEGKPPCFATKKEKCKDVKTCCWGEYCIKQPQLGNESIFLCNPYGPYMLKKMNMLSEVIKLTELAWREEPENKKFMELGIYLSPVGRAFVLVKDQEKPQQAINELKKMPKHLYQSKIGQYVYAFALLERGKRGFKEDRVDNALSDWSEAKQCVINTIELGLATDTSLKALLVSLRKKIDDVVVDVCEKNAKKLKKKQKIEDAIKLLTKALKIVESKPLSELVATFYCDRGNDELTGKRFAKARVNFEKALSFNPDHKMAKQQIGIAYNNEAVEKENYIKAIPMYEKALKYYPNNEVFLKNLTAAYNGRAVEILNNSYVNLSDCNRAIRCLQNGIKIQNPGIDIDKLSDLADMNEFIFNDAVKSWKDDIYKTMMTNIRIAYIKRFNLHGY
jgi:tetratricopeptide (TPR) repeat protein